MPWFYLSLSFFFQALTVVIGKKASMSMAQFSVREVVLNPYYLSVLFCLFLQAVFWQMTLKHFKLSYAYMFMALIYPVILITGYAVYGDKISLNNIVGTGIIVIGAITIVTRA